MKNIKSNFDDWIPSIPAYDLPGAELLSANKVDWKIKPNKAALLIHDFQKYWVNRFVDSEDLQANVSKVLTSCRSQSIPVIYTEAKKVSHPAERGLALELWGPGIGKGSKAKDNDNSIVASVEPNDDDFIIIKPKYSAFYKTDLEEMMRRTNRDQLILSGIYGHHGILATALDAYMRNIQVFYVVDAIGDYSLADHIMSAKYVAEVCGTLTTTDMLCEELIIKK